MSFKCSVMNFPLDSLLRVDSSVDAIFFVQFSVSGRLFSISIKSNHRESLVKRSFGYIYHNLFDCHLPAVCEYIQ